MHQAASPRQYAASAEVPPESSSISAEAIGKEAVTELLQELEGNMISDMQRAQLLQAATGAAQPFLTPAILRLPPLVLRAIVSAAQEQVRRVITAEYQKVGESCSNTLVFAPGRNEIELLEQQ